MFLFIAVGFALRRLGFLIERRVSRLTRITTDILFPCLTFYAVYTSFNLKLFSEVELVFFLAIGVSVIGYFFGRLFAAFLHMPDRMRRVFLYLSFKPASVLIGLPLCVLILGEKSMLFSGPYALGIGLIFYTLGLGILKPGRFSWHTLINPISLTVALGLLLILLKISLPQAILEPLRFLGLLAAPAALITVGTIFAILNFKSNFFDKKMILVAFNKLILAPALMLLFCVFLPLDPLARKVAILMAAVPSSLTASIWALRFDADYTWASSAAIFIGILSIFTIPLFLWIVL